MMHITISPLVQRSAIALALITALGILVHETKIDKATAISIAIPAALASITGIPKLAGEGHNHVERASMANAARYMNGGTPRIQPRDDNKKFTLQKNVVKGVHAFDGYYMPLGEL